MKYLDPDGRVTNHSDLKGAKRFFTELGDCFGGTVKEGLFFEASANVYGVCEVGVEVNLGSTEVSQSLSGVTESKDSCGVSLSLDVGDVASVGLKFERSTTDVENDESLSDAIGNAWKNGTNKVSPVFSVGLPNDSKTADSLNVKRSADGEANEDFKVGVSIGVGVGIGVWVDLSEVRDLFKTVCKGEL